MQKSSKFLIFDHRTFSRFFIYFRSWSFNFNFFERFRFWKNSFLSLINVVDSRNNIKTSKKLRRMWNIKNFVKLLKFILINCFRRFDKLLIMSFIFFFSKLTKTWNIDCFCLFFFNYKIFDFFLLIFNDYFQFFNFFVCFFINFMQFCKLWFIRLITWFI